MSAVAEVSTGASGWSGTIMGFDRAQRMKWAAGVLLLVIVAVAGILMSRQPDWRVLYANLADKDGGAIIAQLSQLNIPYKHSDGGNAILVPADRVHDVRLRLASQGLPKGATSGFELMESNRFGMTQFQERLTFQRGLEGELTRSIQGLSSVQAARVHLALPNQNGFFREQQKPSASVVLSLHPGRLLDRNQLAGIVHLVASSVPEMNPAAVSVLDDTGKLLSNSGDGAGAVDAQQLQYVQQLEQLYTSRIMSILEPVVGQGNVKAQVTAEVDFSQTESTSELHKPNQGGEPGAVRSQQMVEVGPGSTGSNASGVPGATTNQPAAAASAPVNGAAPALSAAGGSAVGAGSKRESVVNYEVDKTVKVVRGASGVVKRLSAAVVVNYKPTTEGAGKIVPKALSDQQVEQMTALVRESIGYSKERGDSVNLMNAPFAVEQSKVLEVPWWKQPDVQDTARSLAWPVSTLLLVTLILLGVVRPSIKAVNQARQAPPASNQLSAVVSDEPERPQLLANDAELVPAAPSREQLMLADARQLAKENPVAVANIVKHWVSGESAS